MMFGSRRNTVWTPEEDEELLRLFAAGRPYWRISAALKRSRAGVVNRLKTLQVQSPQEPASDPKGN
jgi:hypothetical protein